MQLSLYGSLWNHIYDLSASCVCMTLLGKSLSTHVARYLCICIHFCVYITLSWYPYILLGSTNVYINVLTIRTSLVAQWLRLWLPMQGVWVQSLVGKLIPHALWHDQKIK